MKWKRRLAQLLGCLLLWSGCNTSEYEGYSLANSGIHYKRLMLGDDERKPAPGDVLLIHLRVLTLRDSLILDRHFSGQYTGKAGEERFFDSRGIQVPLSMMVEQDSTSFILPTGMFNVPFELGANQDGWGEDVRMEVRLERLITPEESQRIIEVSLDQLELEEQKQLSIYLEEQNIPRENHLQGMYYIPLEAGKGRRPQTGDLVAVHYRASFLDGTEFDSTYGMGEPFGFVLGDPEQVLPGFDKGIRQMQRSGKARFVIPSLVGFGERGSTTGIVPPFKTLIYEVELLQINAQ